MAGPEAEAAARRNCWRYRLGPPLRITQRRTASAKIGAAVAATVAAPCCAISARNVNSRKASSFIERPAFLVGVCVGTRTILGPSSKRRKPPALQHRAIERDGEPWFVGVDAGHAMGYVNATHTLKTLVDTEDKAIESIGLRGSAVNLINESGLYALILKSKKPEAKSFKRWVTSEVLPAIRRNGGYMTSEVAQQPSTTRPVRISATQSVPARIEFTQGDGPSVRNKPAQGDDRDARLI